MEKQAPIKKQKGKNAARQMWNREEDKALLEIIKDRGKTKWSLVAEDLKRILPNTSKTGKQCRERYRNYLDPNVTKKEWTKSDKILFLLLHKQYENHWGQIAKYYVGRSDISLKNLFYSYVRKALKNIKDRTVPSSVPSKPRKVLELYYVVEVIQTKYLPALTDPDLKFPEEKHEKILLNLIKEKQVTAKAAGEYKKRLLAAFKENNKTATFPIVLWISIEGLNLAESRAEILKNLIKDQSFGELSQLILVKIVEDAENAVHFPPVSAQIELPPAPPPIPPLSSGPQSSKPVPSVPVPSLASVVRTQPSPNLIPGAPGLDSTFFHTPPRPALPRVPSTSSLPPSPQVSSPFFTPSYQSVVSSSPHFHIPGHAMYRPLTTSLPIGSSLHPHPGAMIGHPQQFLIWPVVYPMMIPNPAISSMMANPPQRPQNPARPLPAPSSSVHWYEPTPKRSRYTENDEGQY